MFKVIKDFADITANGYVYHKGDTYPVSGEVDSERIKELSTSGNRLGVPLIEEEVEPPKKTRKRAE